MYKTSFVILFVALASVQVHSWSYVLNLANPAPYLDCGPVATLHDVNIDGCTPNDDCDIEAGGVANLHVTFTPQVEAESVQLDIYKFNKHEDKYISHLTEAVCGNGLSCPLKQEKTTFTKSVPIVEMKKERHLLKATLKNEKEEILACALFMANVV